MYTIYKYLESIFKDMSCGVHILLGRKGRAVLTPALFFVLLSEGFQVVVRASRLLPARNLDQVLSSFRLNDTHCVSNVCKGIHITCCRRKKHGAQAGKIRSIML